MLRTKAYVNDLVNIDMIRLTLRSVETLQTIISIINRSIETKVFPGSWKIDIVKPIAKTIHVTQLKDLILSMLPDISKIMERVVERQLRPYL